MMQRIVPMALRDWNWKKIGLFLLFIAATVIFALLLYILFFKPAPPTEFIGNENVNVGGEGFPLANEGIVIPTKNGNIAIGLPPAKNINAEVVLSDTARGGLTYVGTLLDNASRGMSLGPNGTDLIYYNVLDGKFYRMTPDGKTLLLIDKKFYEVDNVNFSKERSKAVIEFPDGANIYFNFNSGEQVTLTTHWQEFEFAKKTDTLAFKNIGLNPENNWIAIANPDGSGARFVEEIGDKSNRVDINWSPDDLVVATYVNSYNDFLSGEQQEVLFLGKNDENFKSMVIEGMNFEGMWSKNGDRMVYSVHNSNSDYRPELWMVNSQGNAIGTGRRNLKIHTWAHKCAFGSNTEVYCGVPTTLEEGVGFAPELANNTPDVFYRIDLKTGQKSLIAQPDEQYSVSMLRVSADGKYLYFIDANTGRLHKINL
jgi:hypothetical protein